MGRPVFILHSALAPDAVSDALRREVDEERWTLFSLSGFRGDCPLLGEIDGNSFRLRKRRYSRNDFAGQFYARFEPESGGTKIEGFFDYPRWAKYFMRVWLAAAILIGVPIFVMTLSDIVYGSHHMSGDLSVGLLVPPSLVLFGLVLPRIGRLLGKRDERFILHFLQNTLGARMDHPV
jgi:hypothetical protein